MPGVFDPTRAFTTKAHRFSLHADAVDLIDVSNTRGFGIPVSSIRVSELGANGQSTMSMIFQDPKKALSIPALARVQFNDHTANEVIFAGPLIGRMTTTYGGQQGYAIDAHCVDYGWYLDTTIVPALTHKAGASDQALIQSVIGHAMRASSRHPAVYAHTSLVTSTNSNMPAFEFSHLTVRAAIEAIQAAAGADRHYYIDFLGRVHYFSGVEASTPAPFTITEHTPSSGGERAPEDLSFEYDDSQIINAVYIFGGAPAGSGWAKDEASVKLYGLRQGTFNAPHCKTAAHRANVGQHFLVRHKDPIVRGSFKITGTDTGWRVGQSVVITNTALGISAASYPIKQIDTTFDGGSGHRTRMIFFGDLPASGRRRPQLGGGVVATAGPPAHAMIQPVRTAGHVGLLSDLTVS